MPKLHELLAVEGNLKGQATKVRTELIDTFKTKRHLFEEKRKTYTSNTENTPAVVEEQKDIQSSVKAEIEWVSRHLAKSVDAAYLVDVANTKAAADIIIEDDDQILFANVPATALLQLEKRAKEWQELISAIPTLDPAKGFKLDPAAGDGRYKAREIAKPRTKKIKKAMVLAPATDKHPAQVALIDTDEETGSILEQEWSALITPGMKADLMDRAETLFRAVTKARAKANEHTIATKDNKIGEALLDYLFQPLTKAETVG
jgi:hypothetical protein